jgi:predicted porin
MPRTSLLALCALVSLTFAGAGRAQSSLAIYGAVDLGIRTVSGDGIGSKTTLASGGYRASRLGLRGTEDLGGGWHAGFKLETTIHADVGGLGSRSLPEHFWNRASIVEIGSRSLGTLRLGHDSNALYRQWLENDPWFSGMGSANSLYDLTQNGPLRETFGPVGRYETTVAYSRRAIQYLSPTLNGFSGVLAYSTRAGVLTTTGGAKLQLLALAYKPDDRLSFAVAHSRTQAQHAAAEPMRRLSDSVVTVAYDLRSFKLAAAVRQFRAETSRETVAFMTATIPVGGGRIQATYGRSRLAGSVSEHVAAGTTAGSIDGNGTSMYALGYVHVLSRRTWLYANAVRMNNHGTSFLGISGGPTPSAGTFSGGSATGFDVGITHNF